MSQYIQRATELAQTAGYNRPDLTLERLGICYISVTMAAAIAHFLISKASFKSHMAFGLTGGTMLTLIWENNHPKKWMVQSDKNKQEWADRIGFAVLVIVPLWSARTMTRWTVAKISKKNMVVRGLYNVGVGTVTAYFLAVYKKHHG